MSESTPRPVALVTGASAGLGEQFALQAARHGYDVVLAARNEARLLALTERLRVRGVRGYVMPVDLAAPNGWRALVDQVEAKGLDIEVLINNAGAGVWGSFLDADVASQAALVQLNCTSVLALTHHFATAMRARGRGRVLNVASIAGFVPGPYMAVYCATKAFVLSLSEALAHEFRGTGVTITCSCPGATATEFGQRSGNGASRLFQSLKVSSPEAVAESAFEAMLAGEVTVVHGFLNWLGTQTVRLAPRALVRSVAAVLNAAPDRG